jgi:hypothetical protein
LRGCCCASTFLFAGDLRHAARAKEVDDVKKNMTLMTTPATGLSSFVAAAHSAHTAPNAWTQGTGVSFAGATAAAQVAVYGARVIDLPGSPPRGAPV